MKLRTSFFNTTVLRKDITRFAPVWGLYGVFTLLFVLLQWEVDETAARFASTAPEILQGMGIVNFLYAPLVAVLLFGDLFTARMCNALHALPMRREGWFLTHLTAGMLFCIVPNGIAALICAILLQQYCYTVFLWLAVMVAQYVFFFGVSAFAAQCAGSRLGALSVYGIFNFLAVIAAWLINTFYESLLYGIRVNIGKFARYSPIVRFSDSHYFEISYNSTAQTAVFQNYLPEDWRYLIIAAVVGVVLLGLSLLLYRKRHLESAGDLISFRPAAPVILVIYTLCVGAVLYTIADLAAPALKILFQYVGFAIGFFTGRMLLERKVRVFRGKNLLAFGILIAVFLATVGITALDPLGMTRYVPEEAQITEVTICSSHYVYDLNNDSLTLTDPEDIQTVTQIHRDCIDNALNDSPDQIPLYVSYTLKNGSKVERYYYVDANSQTADTLRKYFSTPEAVFNGKTAAAMLADLRMIEVYSFQEGLPMIAIATNNDYLDLEYYTGSECRAYLTDDPAGDPLLIGLFNALDADCAAGNMAQGALIGNGSNYADIALRYWTDYGTEFMNISVYDTCKNTVAFLESLKTE